MEALLDNDVLYKLARYDLLADFERLLLKRGFHTPYGKTPAAPWSLRAVRNPLPADRWPDVAQAAQLRDFCFNRCRSAAGTQQQYLEALNVPAFDAGEIALVARALEVPAAFVFTGDKRAIRAVNSDLRLAAERMALSGRFIHLEMLMQSLSHELGWSHVAQRVITSGIDIRLQSVYRLRTESAMAEALAASIESLRSDTGWLLAPSF